MLNLIGSKSALVALCMASTLLVGCQSNINSVLKFTLGEQQYNELQSHEIKTVSVQRRYILEFAENKPLVQATAMLKTSKAKEGVKQLTEMANQGNSYAMYFLGDYYTKKGQRNLGKEWTQKAVVARNYLALLENLEAARKTADQQEIAKYTLELAIIGDLSCQVLTGYNYIYGNGLPTMHEEGLKWLHKVADINTNLYECVPEEVDQAAEMIASASGILSEIYHGTVLMGRYQDEGKYKKYLANAAAYGLVDKQLELAMIYAQSNSTSKLDRANKVFQLALEPKNKSHKVYGLAAYAYAQFIDAHPEIAVNQDSSKYLNIAKKKGVLNDYGKLGNYYYNMLDYSNAKLYYEKALNGNQGDKANGLFGLGMLYLEGKGVKQDYSKALSYYEQAKALNHAAAAVRLGQMYAQGLGVAQDKAKAITYFNQACTMGDIDGCDASKELRGIGIR